MKIYLEDFKKIVQRLEEDHKKSDEYIDSLREVDSSLCDFIFENKYSNILHFQNTFALEMLLGDELFEWVSWYLYDRWLYSEDNDKPNVWIYDVGYKINDIESFMNFAQHGLCLPMKPTNLKED